MKEGDVKYRKKPVVIEAFQWMIDVVPQWWTDAKGLKLDVATGSVFIPTLEGIHEARPGDFIICGVKGELYPCKPDIFSMTYETTEDERKHLESADCWCSPKLVDDFTSEGGVKHYVHNEEQ